MRFVYILAALSAPTLTAQAQHHPVTDAAPVSRYAGEQTREIKALSAQERTALLEGQGQGFARAAELNGYPGPMHVLELARPLALTTAQRRATEDLLTSHKAEARTLGEQLVSSERALDRAMRDRTITPDELERRTAEIGTRQAAVRNSHLQAHLRQTVLLDSSQIARYAELRGYAGAALKPQEGP